MDRQRDLFKRFIRLNSLMRRAVYNPQITARFSIGRKQLYALTVLYEKGKMNMTSLAREIDVSNQQLTKIVDVLVNRQMIERSYDPNNRRIVLVSLTKSGSDYIEDMTSSIIDHIRSKGFEISEERMEVFEHHLSYMEQFVQSLLD